MKLRLVSLEKKSAEEVIILTEAQVPALERKKADEEECGKVETHDYELYLDLNDIEHAKTKARHPRTNRICAVP